MNIVGENFPKKIVDQIKLRQEKKGSLNRNPKGDPSLLVWQNANTGWVKMISSVDIDVIERTKVSNTEMVKSMLPNSELARQYVLFGGVYYQGLGKDGLRRGIGRNYSDKNDGVHQETAYGVGGLDYGLVPMPGITSFNIKTETRGSLKTATIGIKAYNRHQLDIINTLYLSLGFSVLIEWGNTMYYDNGSKNLITDNPYSLADDFLSGKYKWDAILPKINENRLASCGNYDAALGKVVNFTWTVNRDLSYDITVTVRSIGDVIESLKMNALSGYIVPVKQPEVEKPSEETTANSNNIIQSNAYTSDIGVLFYNIMNELQSKDTKTNDLTNDEKDIVAAKINFNGNSKGESYYIRFGYFLHLLEEKIILSLKNTTPTQKIIGFDYDVENNIITLYNRQLSADPTICIFQQNYIYSDGKKITLFPQLNTWLLNGSGSTYKSFYGKLMNVYFDMTYILNQIQNLKDNDGKVSLIDLLKSLSDGFCNATGNYNKISPTVNDNNKIVFIDDISLPDRNEILKTLPLSTDASIYPAEFKMYGYYSSDNTAGMVRDLSLTTTVSPNLATMITIGAQSNGYVTGQDSTALSVMNLGLKDRVKNEFVEPLKPNTVPFFLQSQQPLNNTGLINLGTGLSSPVPVPTLEEKYKDAIASFNKFIQGMAGDTPQWNQDDVDAFSNSISSFAEYSQASVTLKERQTNPTSSSPNIGFLPFDLNLVIDGLSGMKVYQRYIADTEFLPSNYPQSLEFLIKGITHEIKDNQWITTLESLAVPKNPFGKHDDFNVGSPTYGQPGPSERAQGAAQSVRGNNFSTGRGGATRVIEGKTYKNGQMEGALRPINNQAKYKGAITSDTGQIRLYTKASLALDQLIQAAEQAGIPIKINAGYRTYEDQVRVKAQYGDDAATPGTSNHGFGLAVDFAAGLRRIKPGDKLYDWLAAGNGAKYGFKNIRSESWHWEYQNV
jgi:hypothetical protein